MSTVKAGVARKTISPPPGIYLMGYGNRIQGNTGTHDDLYVTTLVLETGDACAALLVRPRHHVCFSDLSPVCASESER